MLSQHQVDRSPDRGKHFVSSASAPAHRTDESTIWHVLLSPGNVQTLTLDQLARYFDEEIITEQTYVWQTGMGEWLRLQAVLDAHPPEPEPEPEEPFSVLMEDRSISKVGIDQLADLYRLGIIQGETLVWQKGMTGWEKLALLADLDESEPETDPFATRSVTPELATVRMNGRANFADEHELPTVERNPVPRAALTPTANQNALGLSTAPVAYSYAPAPIAQGKSAAVTFFLRTGMVAVAFLALLRNDVLYSAATAAKKDAWYLKTEGQALGGPSFGTVRAVDELIRTTGGPLEPVRVPVFVTDLTTRPPAASAASVASKSPVAPKSAPALPDGKTPLASAPKGALGSPLGGNVAAALLGQAKTPTPPVATPGRKAASRKPSSSKSSHPTGSKNYYDPLNGAL